MALKAILDSIDGLPDAVAAEYAPGSGELEGKFVLGVDAVGGYELAPVEKLRSALERERQNYRTAAARLDAFGDVDPSAAREAMEKVGRLGDMVDKEKLDEAIAAREKQLLEKHQSELGASQTERDRYRQELERQLVTSVATQALNKHKARNIDVLLPHVQGQVQVVEKDGRFTAQVVDPATGAVRVSMKQGATGDMAIEEVVERMAQSDEYGFAFEGSGATGSGGGVSNAAPAAPDASAPINGSAPKRIAWDDSVAMGRYADEIAKGQVVVDPPSGSAGV